MNMLRRTQIILAALLGLIAIVIVAIIVLLNFDWNRAKPWVNARASEALGRPFMIAGDLSLTWEKQESAATAQDWRAMIRWPHLVARDIHIGNPTTITASLPADAKNDMANIKQMAFSLNPLALFQKKMIIPVLRFDSPGIVLLRDANGKNNWTFEHQGQSSNWKVDLQSIIFSKGSVHLIDGLKHTDVIANIDTIDTKSAPGVANYGVAWQLRGTFNHEAVIGDGKAGAILSLQHQTAPYPIAANLHIGKTILTAEGTLTKPTDLAALDMHLKVSGVSMARLYALTGVVLPETPPFATEGHLIGNLAPAGNHWIYEKFTGKVGSSDIGGSLDYQPKPVRALVSGDIVSHVLYFPDLAPLIGADSNANKVRRGAPAVQPSNKVLPVEPFKTERWTSIDANIQFKAEKIIRQKELPINKLTTNLRLQDGVLSLTPLNFDIAGGNLSANITLDGSGKNSKDAINATMKVTARHLKLKQLFPTLDKLQASVGEINGDASLSAVGNSVGGLLGASNGEVRTLINQGTISKLLLEEMGLNIGNVIITTIVGDKQVKLNCMATDFGVTNGLMQTRSFIIDTDDAILDVTGNINLAQERMDLVLKPDSKGLRVLSLRSPIYVRGSFKQPQVSVDKGVMAMKAGGALALAALAPLAALIPLVNTGPGESSSCAKLLANARTKPEAPAPGKTYSAPSKPRIK